MQSLLRWGVENSQNEAPVESAQPLDPKVIDMILGRPDAELMKEALNLALDESKDEESRLTALDDFEMVRQSICVVLACSLTRECFSVNREYRQRQWCAYSIQP